MQSSYDYIPPAWLTPGLPMASDLDDRACFPAKAAVLDFDWTQAFAGFDNPFPRNFSEFTTATHGCDISSTNGMVLPEQRRAVQDFPASYLGSDLNGQPLGVMSDTVGSFEGPHQEFLGTKEMKFSTLASENAPQFQERSLVEISENSYARNGSSRCAYPDCFASFTSREALLAHERGLHLRCSECGIEEITQSRLEDHAFRETHASFLCPEDDCGSTFSRLDVMRRHRLNHAADAQRYPCPHCKKYRGKNGFKRKDHLTQHLQGYHHIGESDTSSSLGRSCPKEDCFAYRGITYEDGSSFSIEDHAFQKPSDWSAHMRKVHDESPFPCTFPGCNRVSGKGYFRKRDLKKHISKEHPDHVADS